MTTTTETTTETTTHKLLDSDTNNSVTAEDLGCSETEYAAAIRKSLGCDQPEGHVRVNGRRVYAQII